MASESISTWFAHSGRLPDRMDWQPLQEHLDAVGLLAGQNAAAFGCAEIARASGLLHDLGKYTTEFQQRLSGDYGRVDHATWGARVAVERFGPLGYLMAYGIAGHHAGLANGADGGQRIALKERLAANLNSLDAAWLREIDLPTVLAPPNFSAQSRERGGFQQAFLSRMLFSCLVDADYLDTEAFYDRIEGRANDRRRSMPSLEALREQLSSYLKQFAADTQVDRLRAEILNGVRAKAFELPRDLRRLVGVSHSSESSSSNRNERSSQRPPHLRGTPVRRSARFIPGVIVAATVGSKTTTRDASTPRNVTSRTSEHISTISNSSSTIGF